MTPTPPAPNSLARAVTSRLTAAIAITIGIAASSPALAQNPRALPPVPGQSVNPNTASSLWQYQSGDKDGRTGSAASGNGRASHNVDEVTVVRPFDASQYNTIAVESFDSSRVQLPAPNSDSYRAVHQALREMKPAFIEGITKEARRHVGHRPSNKTLVVRARLTRVDGGSQAGGGTVRIGMSGEILDGATGETLARFAQERGSSQGGSAPGEQFRRTARQLGGDVGRLINSFAAKR